jgi:Domain of unknown function (DUF4407)
VGRFLIWLSGTRKQILVECPTDRPKYVGIGAAILITATMAGISLAFALVTALKIELPLALPFAIGWGVAILCLDRLFVVSLPRKGRRRAHLLRATPRVLLALLLGFVISTPFVLQIFRPEIEHQITLMHTAAENAYLKAAKNGSLQKEIDGDTTQVNNLTAQASGSGAVSNPAQSAELTKMENQLTQAQSTKNNDYNQWQCQLYGSAGGETCHPIGNGRLAKADQQSYDNDVTQVNQLTAAVNKEQNLVNQKIANAQAKSQGEAKAQLPGAQAALAAAVAEQKQEKDAFTSENNNNGGLLIRLQALDAVAGGSITLNVARWLLFALFVVIDCMPVMIKVMLNLGPENNYDRMLEAEERKQLRVAASNRALRQAAEKMAGETVLGEARSRLEGWNASIPGVTQDIIAVRTRVETKKLNAWENDQTRRLANGSTAAAGQQPANVQPPVNFIAWPSAGGVAPRSRWRPPALLQHFGLRVYQFIGLPLLRYRRRKAQAGPVPASGPQPYGAPFSPGPLGPLNGNGRNASRTPP